MLDPITAVATATTAFNLIKKGIAFGQDLDTMSKQLSKWYGAVSDFNYAEREVNNAGGVSKLLLKGSIEQMALDITINKQKIQEQEKELRTLIMYTYGHNVYNEMIELRRKLRKQREQEVYRQREAKRAIVEFFLIVMLIMLVGGFLMFLGYMFFLR
jgi:hypothetical protein|tara:strand:+ start:1624 stop:2094 length:471 start_codon:yes stop_codon:yes gene_type:complete